MARTKTDQMERRVTEILARPYTRMIIPDENGYGAEILEFPGCFASGETAQEAYANLENAAASWLTAELEKGAKIPSPTKHYQAAGAYLWRPARSLQARATVKAAMDGVSLNQYLSALVAEDLGASSAHAQLVAAVSTSNMAVTFEAVFGKHLKRFSVTERATSKASTQTPDPVRSIQ